MPSHFSTIGFSVESQDDFVELAQQVVGQAQAIPAKGGEYLRWKGGGGEELWLQVDRAGDLIGMNPHFTGKSSVRVGITARIRRPPDTPLDGAFHGWARPPGESAEEGAYPFVFDTPDAATYSEFAPPGVVEAQIAAFAHEITFYDSEQAFDSAQSEREVKFASQSFIPSGLFTPEGGKPDAPEAHAIFTGHIVEAAALRNSHADLPFYWALVETLGGTFDVVIDDSLLPQAPAPGGILSGAFWLSGRMTDFPKQKRSWFSKLLRGSE
jgi:hypothetical protein